MNRFKQIASTFGLISFALLAIQGLASVVVSGPAFASGLARNRSATNMSVPSYINYQGTQLIDGDGNLFNGTYTMTFRIYDEVTATSALYTQTVPSVAVRSGTFAVHLGEVDDDGTSLVSVFDDRDDFIGITIEGYPELTPRQRFASVAYAFNAFNATQADQLGENLFGEDGGQIVMANEPLVPDTDSPFTIAVAGDIGADSTTGAREGRGDLVIRAPNFLNSTHPSALHFDSNEVQAFSGDTVSWLGINGEGGNISMGSETLSDRINIRGEEIYLGTDHLGIGVGPNSSYRVAVSGTTLTTDLRVDDDLTIGGNVRWTGVEAVFWPVIWDDNNSGGTASYQQLSAASTSFCALAEVHVDENNSGQAGHCRVLKGSSYWYLELHENNPMQMGCRAVCLEFD